MSAPLFWPGQIVSTPGVLEVTNPLQRQEALFRHMHGDFGSTCAEDQALNREAIKCGDRILSAYPIDPTKPSQGFGENTFWIITEGDRSVTTFLLPSEY